MSYVIQMGIAVTFAKRLSCPAVQLVGNDVRAWLFGGCTCRPEVTKYLDSICSYYDFSSADYTDESFHAMMCKVVGQDMADKALEIIRLNNGEFEDDE